MSCGNLKTSSRENDVSVSENSPNRNGNSIKAADVADLSNFMARCMEFGPGDLVEQNTWNMAFNMASSFLLSVVIFIWHAIRIVCVTFEALYSWSLPVSVMSAFVAMYMNVVSTGFLGMLIVSFQHALTNLGSLNPSAYHSLRLFSIVIVSIWGHLGRRNPASRLERMRARRSDSACRGQLKALVLLSFVRGGHCMTGDPGSPTGGGLGVGEQDFLQRMLHSNKRGYSSTDCIRKVECPILKFSFSRGT